MRFMSTRLRVCRPAGSAPAKALSGRAPAFPDLRGHTVMAPTTDLIP
ncbi:MAG: hypothetical protein ACYDAC_07465 [Candidatus Dormibacteria bacterium]